MQHGDDKESGISVADFCRVLSLQGCCSHSFPRYSLTALFECRLRILRCYELLVLSVNTGEDERREEHRDLVTCCSSDKEVRTLI